MDATKLIEEAEMLCAVASAAPWRCEHGRGRFEIKSGAVSLAGVLYEQDRDFIVGARTLVPALTAALKASEEQNKATTISLRCAEANLKAATAETEPVKSANLAANKRIVELEHERDKERSKVDALLESSALLRGERDAARAELARLTTPQPCEPLDMDCGDNSCMFATVRGGMRTNGGCRCLESLGFRRGPHDSLRRMAAEIVSLRKRLSDLTTPRPIADAPRDGRDVLVLWIERDIDPNVTPEVMHWDDDCAKWMRGAESEIWEQQPTHYVPLPDVKP